MCKLICKSVTKQKFHNKSKELGANISNNGRNFSREIRLGANNRSNNNLSISLKDHKYPRLMAVEMARRFFTTTSILQGYFLWLITLMKLVVSMVQWEIEGLNYIHKAIIYLIEQSYC